MDTHRRFHTPLTWRLVQAEYLALLVALVALGLAHVRDVRWGPFVLAFVLIDLIGYLPGAIAYRRAGRRTIAPRYHHLYNVTHSFLTAGAVAALWGVVHGGPEWAMLALPIHLCGDRGLFGNTYKPAELPFEPEPLACVEASDASAPATRARVLEEVAS